MASNAHRRKLTDWKHGVVVPGPIAKSTLRTRRHRAVISADKDQKMVRQWSKYKKGLVYWETYIKYRVKREDRRSLWGPE